MTTPETESEIPLETSPEITAVPGEELPTSDSEIKELNDKLDSLPDKVAAALVQSIKALRAEDTVKVPHVEEPVIAPGEPVAVPLPAVDKAPAETHWYYRPLSFGRK